MKKKVIAIIAVLAATIKLADATGAAVFVAGNVAAYITSGAAAERLLYAELAIPSLSLDAAVLITSLLPLEASVVGEPTPTSAEVQIDSEPKFTPPTAEPSPTPNLPDEPSMFYGGIAAPQLSTIDNSSPISGEGILIKNNSGLEFDLEALLREPLEVSLAEEGPSVLIIHTHSSESYTKAAGEKFEESDPYRTEDKAYNIIAVGEALADALAARGISVIQDRGLNDYPSYAGAYGRSLETAKRYLAEYPSISLIIDLHRDAMEMAEGSQFKTIADINGELCSQVMLVVGTNGSGLAHPAWHENFKLALRLQHEMNRSYPTLARPINIAEHRYNQHVTSGALLLEIGATGNTLQESLKAAQHFADVYADVVTAGNSNDSRNS